MERHVSLQDDLEFQTTKVVDNTEPLVHGFGVDQAGQYQALSWEDISSQSDAFPDSWRWIHLNRESAEAQRWLNEHCASDNAVSNVLLQQDSRPRITKHLDGYLINLRGVNTNPGAEPEDMIALRIWATPKLVISTRARPVLAAEDLKETFIAGNPPSSSGAIIAYLAHRLVSRIGPVVSELDEGVDALEEEILDARKNSLRSTLSGLRRTALSLRRYIAPQREAIAGFLRESNSFLTEDEKHHLRETHDTVVRVAEDLDLIRERAMLLHEQLVEERAEAMNSRLFILAIVSAVFLPLGFITGLFGVNVGGMPGVDSPAAFYILCGSIGLFSIAIIWIFWRMKWI